MALQADFEFGGTDQKFNLLVGRDIMREFGLEPQVILTTPLLEGTDGVEKMSKSLGNCIGFTEPAEDMFGKVMSVSDELMFRYWELLTDRPMSEVRRMRQEMEAGRIHPMDLKSDLGREIVGGFHGADAADRARERFARVHQRGLPPEEMDEYDLGRRESLPGLVELLVLTSLVPSRSEARRMIKAGAVSINGKKVLDPSAGIPAAVGQFVLRCGKLRFCRVRTGSPA